MDHFLFKTLELHPNNFFEILPQDWQEEIVPYWKNYENSAKVYVIEKQNELIGGGIVFSTCSPDIIYYKDRAQQWFDNGFLYIGFLWVAENYRNQQLGSFWIEELKKNNPKQKYWLLIEDERLHDFYKRNDFKLEKTIDFGEHKEWLYSFTPILS